MKPTRSLATAVALLLWAVSAQAQILIGQTVGVTGAVAATVKESMTGAMLHIDDGQRQGWHRRGQDRDRDAGRQVRHQVGRRQRPHID